jgi:hypothetical protein
VKIRFFGKEMVLIVVCFIFLFSALAFAQGKDVVKYMGKIVDLDVSKRMLIVNEDPFVWDKNTLFYDEEGSPTTAVKLQKNIQVSIEGKKIKGQPYLIKKIYILPPK